MDKCDAIERTIRYFDNELSGAERLAAESHLESCASCRACLDDLRALSSAFRQTYDHEPRPGALADVRRRTQRRVERASYGLLSAAMVLLVSSVAWSVYVTASMDDHVPAASAWEEYAVTSLNPEDEILGREPRLNVGAWMQRGLTHEGPHDE